MSHKTLQPRILIGEEPSHWLYGHDPPHYDLSRPTAPQYARPSAGASITMLTTTESITIDPQRTALVIIDMQNLFLSPALGADPDSPANIAKDVLINTAIPAARKAGIRVVWLNWGLADDDVKGMPPSILKGFGFRQQQQQQSQPGPSTQGSPDVVYRTKGIGFDLGSVQLEDGTPVEAGRLLMTGSWNTQLPPDLDRVRRKSSDDEGEDIWIHKNRISGFGPGNQHAIETLRRIGITTLLFAGTKTDVCVAGSVLDAWHAGFDVVLLEDACGTTSPQHAIDSVLFNCAAFTGFVTKCRDLETGVEQMMEAAASPHS